MPTNEEYLALLADKELFEKRWNDAEDKVRTLELQVEGMRKILREVEWVTDIGLGNKFCPECENQKGQGHLENCALGHALHGAFPPGEVRPSEKRKCESEGPYGLRCEREAGHGGSCAGGREGAISVGGLLGSDKRSCGSRNCPEHGKCYCGSSGGTCGYCCLKEDGVKCEGTGPGPHVEGKPPRTEEDPGRSHGDSSSSEDTDDTCSICGWSGASEEAEGYQVWSRSIHWEEDGRPVCSHCKAQR